jgi:site-specific DNA-methyltransferase (adenine-specific)
MEVLAQQERLRFGKAWDGRPVLSPSAPAPTYRTPLGVLFEADCLEILPHLEAETVDTVFADPPFNLGKDYGKKHNDSRSEREYLSWCHKWLDECIRVLKPGGAIFLYNLPKWNVQLGAYLIEQGLTFRHDIAVNIKLSLPIPGRLYPSHYSLLYLTKGAPKTFRRIRTPIERCRHCGGEIKDYGGHRGAMNPRGVNLTDVWNDIPPVRHWKYKNKRRGQNQLSTKLVWRCIQLSTYAGEIVLDPFGGAGTTYDVCESTGRRWLGVEIQNIDVIVERLEAADLAHHRTTDVIDDQVNQAPDHPSPLESGARSG